MPDETIPSEAEPLEPPKRESVSMKEADRPEDESPAERSFFTRATRVKLEDEEHDKLARLLDQCIDSIDRERQDGEWDANWDLWEDLYFGVLQDRPVGQANVHVPIAQEVVDTSLAVAEQALFTSRPWLNISPRESSDVDGAKRKERFLDYALTVEMMAKDKIDPSLWEAGALGTGVSYIPWLREVERIRDEETYDGLRASDMERFVERYPSAEKDYPEIVSKLRAGKKVTLTVEYNESRQDAPEVTFVPLRRWRVRPKALWHKLHRERYLGHTFDIRYADIEELVDQNYYDQRISRLAFKWDDGQQDFVDDPSFQDKQYEIETGCVRWRRPSDSRERRYLVDFHRESRTVLRIMHYPYWHNRPNYIPWYFQRSRTYIYGVSLIQKVEHSQFEANAAHSLTLDAVAFGAIPMFKARSGTEMKFNPMRDGMYAGKTWYFDNPDTDAQAFQTGVTGAVSVLLNLEDRAARHAELASGASQNLSGLESSRDPDAPGNKTQILVQQAHVRIAKYLSTLSWSLSELGFQTCELYYQFSPKGRQYRVMGQEGTPVFETISRQELRLRADFTPNGSTAALNPDREKKEVFEMGQLLLKTPEVAQSAIRRLAVLEMMLDAAGDVWSKSKSKVLPGPEEMRILREQDDAKLKAASAGGGLPPPGAPAPAPNGNGNGRMDPTMLAMLSGRGIG